MSIRKASMTSTSYPPAIGGAQIHSHEILKQLAKQGIDVSVMTAWSENRTDWLLGTTLKAPIEAKAYSQDGIPIVQPALSTADKISLIPGAALYYFLPELGSPLMASVWRKHLEASLPADTEIIHNVRIGREHITEASLDLAHSRGIPFAMTPNHSPRMNRIVSRRLFHLYRNSEMIFVFTHLEKQQLIELGVKPNHISVIGAGPVLSEEYDAAEFKQKHNIQGKMVLFLGQKYPYKGYETILEASKEVWEQFPDTYFVFIGPNYPESVPIFEKYHDQRIINIGGVAPFAKDKASALAACDIFCLPSRQEGFGGVFTEAWNFKKPVIGGDIPPLREIINDGVNGFIVPQQASVLAKRLKELLGNEDLAHNLGQAGWEKVQRYFRWEIIAETVREGYEQAQKNFHA